MPTNTRERLLETAGDLFYQHGFQAVGLDRVLDEVGITKTAFYKHFESKDELIVAVLNFRDGPDIAKTLEYMRQSGGDSPRDQVLSLFDFLDAWFRDPGFRGCLFMNAATEFPTLTDPINQAALRHYKNMQVEVERLIEEMEAPEPGAVTSQIMLLLRGAINARHIAGVLDSANSARRVAEVLLDSVRGTAKPPARRPTNARPGKATPRAVKARAS